METFTLCGKNPAAGSSSALSALERTALCYRFVTFLFYRQKSFIKYLNFTLFLCIINIVPSKNLKEVPAMRRKRCLRSLAMTGAAVCKAAL